MIWLTRLRTWWANHLMICWLRRDLAKRDPEAMRLMEEYGQRKRK